MLPLEVQVSREKTCRYSLACCGLRRFLGQGPHRSPEGNQSLSPARGVRPWGFDKGGLVP